MRFDVKFNLLNDRIPVIFEEKDQLFHATFGTVHEVSIREEAEYYKGSYEVTPTVEGETLPTAKKTMVMDLLVNKIPYAVVTNTANGLTVTIAE